MAMISCVDCGEFLGNLPVEYGSKFYCGDCSLQRLDEMTLDEHILTEAYEDAISHKEADCGE